MTREEVIAVLKGYIGNPLVNDTKAFEMAIKVLEQEPKARTARCNGCRFYEECKREMEEEKIEKIPMYPSDSWRCNK